MGKIGRRMANGQLLFQADIVGNFEDNTFCCVHLFYCSLFPQNLIVVYNAIIDLKMLFAKIIVER